MLMIQSMIKLHRNLVSFGEIEPAVVVAEAIMNAIVVNDDGTARVEMTSGDGLAVAGTLMTRYPYVSDLVTQTLINP